jgi:hypothetical protein
MQPGTRGEHAPAHRRLAPPEPGHVWASLEAVAELELVRTIAAVIAPGSVVIAMRALRANREQARTAFEDALAREYRDIAGALPPAAFYIKQAAELNDLEIQAMFRYFDLSNEQLRLIDEGRIRAQTAEVWTAGIEGLLRFDTFAAAWKQLRPELPEDFFTSLDGMLRERGLTGEVSPPSGEPESPA